MCKILDKIIESNITEKNIEGGNKETGREKIFDQFTKAIFDGNLLPIDRQIEKTFGKGYLKRLGKEDFYAILGFKRYH